MALKDRFTHSELSAFMQAHIKLDKRSGDRLMARFKEISGFKPPPMSQWERDLETRVSDHMASFFSRLAAERMLSGDKRVRPLEYGDLPLVERRLSEFLEGELRKTFTDEVEIANLKKALTANAVYGTKQMIDAQMKSYPDPVKQFEENERAVLALADMAEEKKMTLVEMMQRDELIDEMIQRTTPKQKYIEIFRNLTDTLDADKAVVHIAKQRNITNLVVLAAMKSDLALRFANIKRELHRVMEEELRRIYGDATH